MDNSKSSWIIFLLAVAGLAAAAWWYLQPRPESAVEPAASVEAADTAAAGPLHPMSPPLPANERGELVDLPALDDSDGYFKLALLDLFGLNLDTLLVNEALIEKFVTTVDNLPRSQIAEKIRPLQPISGLFIADANSDGETFTLNQDNYRRYDFLVDMLANADLDAIVDGYRRFYPLLQQSYVRLGYPSGYFNDRLVEVIDHLLETPFPDQPIRLVRPHVLYEFADPELEALSSGQKLLIRIGPDNAARVRTSLGELRLRIA